MRYTELIRTLFWVRPRKPHYSEILARDMLSHLRDIIQEEGKKVNDVPIFILREREQILREREQILIDSIKRHEKNIRAIELGEEIIVQESGRTRKLSGQGEVQYAFEAKEKLGRVRERIKAAEAEISSNRYQKLVAYWKAYAIAPRVYGESLGSVTQAEWDKFIQLVRDDLCDESSAEMKYPPEAIFGIIKE
jgi:hypothetical protein